MNTADLSGRLTVTIPEAGQLLGIGRDAAYRAAEAGQIPSLRVGRRLLVPLPALMKLVGSDIDVLEASHPATEGHAA